jgi:RimJ/RimL family protein N-acetyltransferase
VVLGVHLHAVPAETLRALHAGATDWAATESGLPRSLTWPAGDRRMLRYRVDALDADPNSAPYLLHLVLDDAGRLLGRIGCHAAPTDDGEVEIGYFVVPAERERGVAGSAVDLFLTWLRDQGVRRVVATVTPDNTPSRRILEQRGFIETGTRMDDEDGLELVYALDLPSIRSHHCDL